MLEFCPFGSFAAFLKLSSFPSLQADLHNITQDAPHQAFFPFAKVPN